MRCLATNNGTEDDNGIVTVVERHLVSTVDQLEASRNGLHMDVLRQGAMLLKRRDTTIEQSPRNLRIPFSHNDTENHIRCIGHFRNVVVGEILCCHSLFCRYALDISVDGLRSHRVEVLLLHGLIELQSLIVFTLTLENLTSLNQEGG